MKGEKHHILISTNQDVMPRCLAMKKMMIIGAFYCIAATGLWIFLLNKVLSIPGLNHQIKRLEKEVDRLDIEIEDLASEVDRLEILVDRMDALNDELRESANDLNSTVGEYRDLNVVFNLTLSDQIKANDVLQKSLEIADGLNDELSKSIQSLDEHSNTIVNVNQRLGAISQTANALNNELLEVVKYFDDVDEILLDRINELEKQNLDLDASNDELSRQIDDLVAIMYFLNTYGEDFNSTVEVITSHLADRIREDQDLLLNQLDIYYTSRYNQWSCGPVFTFEFGSESWVVDIDEPIGVDGYILLLNFIESTLFSELCIDREEFESFLLQNEETMDITFRDVHIGVVLYSSELMQFYFSGSDVTGLTSQDWADAQYSCDSISSEKVFQYPY